MPSDIEEENDEYFIYVKKWIVDISPDVSKSNPDFQTEYTSLEAPVISVTNLDVGRKYTIGLRVEFNFFRVEFADVSESALNFSINALVETMDYVITEDVDVDFLLLVDNSDALDTRSAMVTQG